MASSHADFHDLESDVPSASKAKLKGRRRKDAIATVLLGVLAIGSAAWGAHATWALIRVERSIPRDVYRPVPPPPPLIGAKIDHEHFQKIREGMSFDEVKHLLGGPPGFCNGVVQFKFIGGKSRFPGKGPDQGIQWFGRSACIGVLLNEAGFVIDKEYCPGEGDVKITE